MIFNFKFPGRQYITVDGISLDSNLREVDGDDDVDAPFEGDDAYHSAIDGMESLLLNLVAEGVITASNQEQVQAALSATLEHIANNT